MSASYCDKHSDWRGYPMESCPYCYPPEIDQLEEAKQEIASLREALEFYADYEEWVDYKAVCADGTEVDSHFDGDMGQRARDALGIATPEETGPSLPPSHHVRCDLKSCQGSDRCFERNRDR